MTVSCYLITASFLTCFGSSFLYGYNLGVFNLPAKLIKTYLTSDGDDKERQLLFSLASSAFVMGGAIGAFCSGFFAERIGRKPSLMMNNVIGIIGAVILYISYPTSVRALLYLGRVIVGLNCGLTMGLASMYLTEIAPTKLRGELGACHQLAIVAGILVSNILTFDKIFGTYDRWTIACGLVGVPPLIQLIFMGFMPESPRFLFIKKGLKEAAIEAKRKLDPDVPSDQFAREAQEEVDEAATMPPFRFIDIFQRKYTRAMVVACFIQVMQQASGIKAIVAYSTIMMGSAGVDASGIQYFAAGLTFAFFIGTFVSVVLIDRLGRRTLLLWPSLVTIASLVGMCITTELSQKHEDLKLSSSIAAIVLVYIYQVSFALGMGPVPGLIVSEMFNQGPRAAAYSISQATLWLCVLTVYLAYPNLELLIGGYIFLIFAILDSIIWVLLFFMMPETKGKTFEEVAELLGETVHHPHDLETNKTETVKDPTFDNIGFDSKTNDLETKL